MQVKIVFIEGGKRRRRRKAKPMPVCYFKAKADNEMKTVRLAWVLPTTRVDGSALALADISSVQVDISVDGGQSWTELNKVAPEETALEVPDLVDGTYNFRATVIDKQTPARSSAAVSAVANVVTAPVVLAEPSPVGTFTAVVVG